MQKEAQEEVTLGLQVLHALERSPVHQRIVRSACQENVQTLVLPNVSPDTRHTHDTTNDTHHTTRGCFLPPNTGLSVSGSMYTVWGVGMMAMFCSMAPAVWAGVVRQTVPHPHARRRRKKTYCRPGTRPATASSRWPPHPPLGCCYCCRRRPSSCHCRQPGRALLAQTQSERPARVGREHKGTPPQQAYAHSEGVRTGPWCEPQISRLDVERGGRRASADARNPTKREALPLCTEEMEFNRLMRCE